MRLVGQHKEVKAGWPTIFCFIMSSKMSNTSFTNFCIKIDIKSCVATHMIIYNKLCKLKSNHV